MDTKGREALRRRAAGMSGAPYRSPLVMRALTVGRGLVGAGVAGGAR